MSGNNLVFTFILLLAMLQLVHAASTGMDPAIAILTKTTILDAIQRALIIKAGTTAAALGWLKRRVRRAKEAAQQNDDQHAIQPRITNYQVVDGNVVFPCGFTVAQGPGGAEFGAGVQEGGRKSPMDPMGGMGGNLKAALEAAEKISSRVGKVVGGDL